MEELFTERLAAARASGPGATAAVWLRAISDLMHARLAFINTAAPKWNLDVVGINYPDFDRWRKDQKLFEAITVFETANFNLADGGGAERVRGLQITADCTKVFGIEPLLGRSFTADEDQAERPPVVMIGAA